MPIAFVLINIFYSIQGNKNGDAVVVPKLEVNENEKSKSVVANRCRKLPQLMPLSMYVLQIFHSIRTLKHNSFIIIIYKHRERKQ